jgi:hypothetical protein
MNLSQSLIKNLFDENNCPRAIKYEYLERREGRKTDAMQRGQLFEYYLTGALPRDGKIPELEKGVKGNKLKPETDLEECVSYAKEICRSIGLDLENADKQIKINVEIEGIQCSAYLDMLTKDIDNPAKDAIYDIKYTETKYDDRWNGWANFDEKEDAHIQARHYILLAKEMFGEWMPYYFLIFGKSGWIRIIKCIVTEGSIMNVHMVHILRAKEMLEQHEKAGWIANPEFNKCLDCPHYAYCEDKETAPKSSIHYI